MNINTFRLAITALALISAVPWSHAADIFVDNFDGNSGGLPGGWTLNAASDTRPETSVIEGGGTVAITDLRGEGPTRIDSPQFSAFPAGSTRAELNILVAGTSSTGSASPEAIVSFGGTAYSLLVLLSQSGDRLGIAIADTTGGGSPAMTHIAGSPFDFSYGGEAVSFNVSFDTGSLRVTSNLNSFDTGAVAYSSIGLIGFGGIADFGPLAQISLFSEAAEGEGTATITYDRVSYSTDAPPASRGPSIKITSPKSKGKLPRNRKITIRGEAAQGSAPLASYRYRLNNSGWKTGGPLSGSRSKWSKRVGKAKPGRNTIQARSFDVAGQSSPVATRKVRLR